MGRLRDRLVLRVLLVLMLLSATAFTVLAATAGPNSPGTAANDTSIGTVAWINPRNITSSDERRAVANLDDFNISNYLIARNFSFSIPASATINGIVVTIERQKQNGAGIINDYSVKLLKNGIIQGSNKANQTEWTANYDSNVTYGGPTDLWALSLTPADLNNISFGVAIAAIKNNTNGNSFAARVDNIRITVYYTPDTTPPVVTVPANMTVEATSPAGATATFTATAVDNIDGAITPTCIPASGSTFPLGLTTVNCTATDSSGNTGSNLFTVAVVDTTAPVITLLGINPINVTQGDAYSDAGATALDIVGGNLTASILTVNPVNTSALGTYTITYDVNDSSGNAAAQVTRIVNIVDTTPPVITMLGSTPLTIEVHTPYVDAGATALDNYDGDITASIITANPVNTSTLGTYTITYDVTDSSGNAAATVTRTVNVVDTTLPTISLLGSDPITVEAGIPYVDTGATALDNYDGNITASITAVNPVNTSTLGTYTIAYDVNDSSGNAAAQVTRTVNVVDTTPPTITLLGNNATIEVGSVYTDAGATALDTHDGNLTGSIISVNPINSSALGTYTITYDVTDSSGNAAATVTRTVKVVDTTLPVITVMGTNPIDISFGNAYTDAGATALDNYDGNITASITAINPVNTSALGTYTITYNVNDSSGNAAAQITRTVNVVDTAIPIITMLGTSPITVALGSVYTDAGATALDDVDGDITASIITASNVDTNTIGNYSVTYNVTDSSGNPAAKVTRIVEVLDLTPPVITLLGSDPVTAEAGMPYVDAGATALDNVDGDITASIIIVNPVDTNTLGTYTITYDVSDSTGNDATPVTRTVNVVDTTAPVITRLGSNPETVEVGSAYTDAGATAVDSFEGSITGAIVVASDVNTSTLGTYTVTYNVNDSSGNNAVQVKRTVNVVDTTAPTITLVGSSSATITVGNAYVDEGATASDNYDGNITGAIVTANNVNTSAIGEYNVTYNVTDSSGNAATQVTRTVNVVAAPAPAATSTATHNANGLGPDIGSHFAQQAAPAPAAAPAAPAAAPAPAPAPAPAAPAAPAPAGGTGMQPAPTAPRTGNEITGAAVAPPGNQITGAVTGTNRKTALFWVIGLLALVAALLAARRIYKKYR